MKWTVALIVAYLALGLDLTLGEELALSPGVRPSLLVPLMVFVAMSAPPSTALWFAVLTGVLQDLTSEAANASGTGVVFAIGPNALGSLAAAYLVLVLRGLTLRRNPISLVVLSILAAAVAAIVAVFLLSFRSMYDADLAWSPWLQLGRRLLAAGYTGLAAGLMAFALLPLSGVFGFPDPQGRRFGRRGY